MYVEIEVLRGEVVCLRSCRKAALYFCMCFLPVRSISGTVQELAVGDGRMNMPNSLGSFPSLPG